MVFCMCPIRIETVVEMLDLFESEGGPFNLERSGLRRLLVLSDGYVQFIL